MLRPRWEEEAWNVRWWCEPVTPAVWLASKMNKSDNCGREREKPKSPRPLAAALPSSSLERHTMRCNSELRSLVVSPCSNSGIRRNPADESARRAEGGNIFIFAARNDEKCSASAIEAQSHALFLSKKKRRNEMNGSHQ